MSKIPEVHTDITKLMSAAYRKSVETNQTAEAGKLGVLRGGNSAILAPDGNILGKCARRTLLRYKGIEVEDPHTNKQIMFAAGLSNEDIWYDKLVTVWPGSILREEEVGTKWTTDSGVDVTGRPDIVLCETSKLLDITPELILEADTAEKRESLIQLSTKEIDTPVLGLELKMCASLWTARDVMFEGKPKWDHLVQSAHYSMALDIPFKLCYTNYVNFAVPGWAGKLFPAMGEKHSELLGYNEKTGKPKHVGPFITVYTIGWSSDGYLTYQTEDGSEPLHTTVITKESIRAYYEYVSTMEERKDLGPRPKTLKGDGTKANFSSCDYCPLINNCNENEGDFEAWMNSIHTQT